MKITQILAVCLVAASLSTPTVTYGQLQPDPEYAATSSASQGIVPDEMIVKFAPSAAALLDPKTGGAIPGSSGLAWLDDLNGQARAEQMEALFPAAAKSLDSTSLGGTYLLHLAPGSDVRAATRAYAADPHVLYAEPNFLYHTNLTPNDPYYPQQWNLENSGQTLGTAGADIHMEEAWDLETGSSSVIIAVIDTGVDYKHEDLSSKIWKNSAEIAGNGVDDDGNGYVDDIRGWDFVNVDPSWVAQGEDPGPPDNNPMDFDGHGTMMAGIAAARADNGKGVAGVCSGCTIMPLRVAYRSASGGGQLSLSDAAEAVRYATDNGARVINMSFGGYDAQTMADAVRYAADHGVFMAAAAGNYGGDIEFYPAAYPQVFSVAATDQNDRRAVWMPQTASNLGFWVTAAAPGNSIFGTWPGNSYTTLSGTSAATPQVAGLAGLLFSKYPGLSAGQARTAIVSAADPIRPDEYIGAGRINAAKALTLAAEVPDLEITSPASNSQVTGAVPVLGTAAGAGFQAYTLEAGAGDYPSSWTTICAGNQPVSNGELGMWDPAGLPTGVTILRLKVTGQAGMVTETQVRVLVDHRLLAGWPLPMAVNSPTLADLNGDRASEILLNDQNGQVHVLNASGGELPGWPQAAGLSLAGSPAAGNVDGDPELEVAAATLNTSPEKIYLWNADGSLLPGWPVDLGSEMVGTPAIADLDGDGQGEVIASTIGDSQITSSVHIHIWKANGSELDGWPRSIPISRHSIGEYTTGPCLGDLDHDGRLEIVFGDNDGWVHALTLDGAELDGWPRRASPNTDYAWTAYAVLGDVNGDGNLDVVGLSVSFDVHVWNADGTEMAGWPQSIPGYSLSRPSLADLDGDGKLEVLVHANNDNVYAWHADGNLVQGYPIWLRIQYGNPVWSQLLAVDADGDDLNEVLALGDERRVEGWTGQGQPMAGGPFNTIHPAYTSAAVGDVNGDGWLVLVGADSEQVYVWRLDVRTRPDRLQWPMFQHDAQHTGLFTLPPKGGGSQGTILFFPLISNAGDVPRTPGVPKQFYLPVISNGKQE